MIADLTAGRPELPMDEEILVDLAPQVGRHPWWSARSRLVLALLSKFGIEPPARVLDAGCGWGTTLKALERRGYRTAGLDVSLAALERLDRPDRSLFRADLAGESLDGLPGDFEATLALDVIEHMDDDRGALTRLAETLRPGGLLVVSVPALPALFSEFDRVQGHRRRYLPETLRAAFEGTGLELEFVSWWGAWLVPLLARSRRRPKADPGESPAATYRRHLKLPPRPISWAFRLAFDLEQGRTLRGLTRTGTSLFAAARRPVPDWAGSSARGRSGRTAGDDSNRVILGPRR